MVNVSAIGFSQAMAHQRSILIPVDPAGSEVAVRLGKAGSKEIQDVHRFSTLTLLYWT